jgi:hypothetical protein
MKKILFPALFFLMAQFLYHKTFATNLVLPVEKISSDDWIYSIKLSKLVKMNYWEFQKLSGKKINFIEKIAFKIGKAKMKRYLKKHADIPLADYSRTVEAEKKKFSFLWFCAGLLLLPAGVIIMGVSGAILFTVIPVACLYLTKQDNYEKGSYWTGLGIAVLLALIFGAIGSGAFNY